MDGRKRDSYVADFYTTTDTSTKNEQRSEVWASVLTKLGDTTERVLLNNSIDGFIKDLTTELNRNRAVVYLSNLSLKGSYLIDYLLHNGYSTATDAEDNWIETKDMPVKSFKCTINEEGIWYSITIKENYDTYIYFRDSIKLLPFSDKELGNRFSTKYSYKELVIEGKRFPYGELRSSDKEVIKNNILMMSEALNKFVNEMGHNNITIGACCKSEYVKSQDKRDFKQWFPNLAYDGYDKWFRPAYRGGWCYLMPNKKNVILGKGCTLDVNSLFPSKMNGNDNIPVGYPHKIINKNQLREVKNRRNQVYFIHFKCNFVLKDSMLPTTQIKGSVWFDNNEYPETSFIYDEDDDSYKAYYEDFEGNIVSTAVEFTMCDIDYELFLEHYNIMDFEFIDGYWFWCMPANILFGQYINKYMKIKESSDGVDRVEAKLFANNLYGKLGTKTETYIRIPYLDEDGNIMYKELIKDYPNKAWYIPAACYIAALARKTTIDAAQANYDCFVYSDTDSLHLECDPFDAKGVELHPTKIGAWAIESEWSEAIFAKTKTYIENTEEGYVIKAAGMLQRSKDLIAAKLSGVEIPTKNSSEADFMKKPFNLSDFRTGLKVPGHLINKRVKGGTIQIDDHFTIR